MLMANERREKREREIKKGFGCLFVDIMVKIQFGIKYMSTAVQFMEKRPID